MKVRRAIPARCAQSYSVRSSPTSSSRASATLASLSSLGMVQPQGLPVRLSNLITKRCDYCFFAASSGWRGPNRPCDERWRNNSSDVLNTQGVLGSPRHISGDKSTIEPAAASTERPRAYNWVESMRNVGRETSIVRFLFSTMSQNPASRCDELRV